MKLAEALQERADLRSKIDDLRSRLANNALVQEGETTAEDPEELLQALDAAVLRTEELTARVNKTNCLTREGDKSVTELNALSLQLSIYRNIINEASQTARRARGTEIKVVSAVNVRELQKKADHLAQELRKTDNRIQELNWKTELLQ